MTAGRSKKSAGKIKIAVIAIVLIVVIVAAYVTVSDKIPSAEELELADDTGVYDYILDYDDIDHKEWLELKMVVSDGNIMEVWDNVLNYQFHEEYLINYGLTGIVGVDLFPEGSEVEAGDKWTDGDSTEKTYLVTTEDGIFTITEGGFILYVKEKVTVYDDWGDPSDCDMYLIRSGWEPKNGELDIPEMNGIGFTDGTYTLGGFDTYYDYVDVELSINGGAIVACTVDGVADKTLLNKLTGSGGALSMWMYESDVFDFENGEDRTSANMYSLYYDNGDGVQTSLMLAIGENGYPLYIVVQWGTLDEDGFFAYDETYNSYILTLDGWEMAW